MVRPTSQQTKCECKYFSKTKASISDLNLVPRPSLPGTSSLLADFHALAEEVVSLTSQETAERC